MIVFPNLSLDDVWQGATSSLPLRQGLNSPVLCHRPIISPEMISLRLQAFGHLEEVAYIKHESIYQWLYKQAQKKEKLHKLLHQAHAKLWRKKRVYSSTIKNRTSIHERPAAATDRNEVRHWEIYLMAFLRN